MINKKQQKLFRLVERIWSKNPSLRLCQLLQNCYGMDDIYHITDEALVEKLKECYDI